MAHTSTGEINYFFQDEQGKILKVLKHTEIKEEPSAVEVYANNSSNVDSSTIVGYSPVNSSSQPQFIRLQNSYSIQPAENATYAVITGQGGGNTETIDRSEQQLQQQSLSGIKYETPRASVKYNTSYSRAIKAEGKNQKDITHHSHLHTTNKSKAQVSTASSVQRKRKPEKAGKGLRHFSMKVCEKVKEKGTTTYNEVADELVAEEIQNQSYDSANCDQKNIRRRVYDALNVLMAMNIISKDKKEIRWIGLPTNSVEQFSALEKDNEKRRERIEAKHQQLRELLLQQVSFKSLAERNKDAEKQGIIPTTNSSIQLPFIIVNTHKSTKINCSVTNDKSEYIFKFDDKFEMHDDAEVLKRMGLLLGLDKGTCTYEDIERAKTLVPHNFEKYIEAYGRGEGLNTESDEEMPSYITITNESRAHMRTEDGHSPDLDPEEYLEESDID